MNVAIVDFQERQVTLKLVYYGPPLSGKTTNLKCIHGCVDELNRGRLMTLNTRDDRTLFFDLLPIFFKASGLSFRVKVYTVPGQPMHATTRRVVLTGADGIVFVADAQTEAVAANNVSYRNLLENMSKLGLDRNDVPIVIQYNKTDLPNTIGEQELEALRGKFEEPLYSASALNGEGVRETFVGLLQHTWQAIDRRLSVASSFGITSEQFLGAMRDHMALSERSQIAPARDGSTP